MIIVTIKLTISGNILSNSRIPENEIALEISARKGHCLANGHVAKIATEIGADLVIDTDCHDPDDLISFKQAYRIALGAGLSDSQAMKALIDNPHKILNRRLS